MSEPEHYHDDPRRRSWSVQMHPGTNRDGEHVMLLVSRSDASHVDESDAAWLRKLIREHRAVSELPAADEVEP